MLGEQVAACQRLGSRTSGYIVEGVIPLHNVTLSVRGEWTTTAAYLAPEHIELLVVMDGAYARVRVPRVTGHAIVVRET